MPSKFWYTLLLLVVETVLDLLLKRADLDIGWVLSEDRTTIKFQLNFRESGSAAYSRPDLSVMSQFRPLRGTLAEWTVLPYSFSDMDWFSSTSGPDMDSAVKRIMGLPPHVEAAPAAAKEVP